MNNTQWYNEGICKNTAGRLRLTSQRWKFESRKTSMRTIRSLRIGQCGPKSSRKARSPNIFVAHCTVRAYTCLNFLQVLWMHALILSLCRRSTNNAHIEKCPLRTNTTNDLHERHNPPRPDLLSTFFHQPVPWQLKQMRTWKPTERHVGRAQTNRMPAWGSEPER
jgi:hypothetical protein